MASILKKIWNLLIILKIFNYFATKATLKWLFGMAKQAQLEWARLTFEYLQVKAHEFPGSKPLKQGKIMVYANHRSQADFFLDNVLLNFQTNFLSRLGVLIAAPVFIVAYKHVWFFNRNNKTDPEKFNLWLDKKFAESPRPSLLVYPQGHRMQGTNKVDIAKIKTGMLKYAYRRQMPSQIFMTFGNQDIFDQKRIHVAFGQTCYYKMSQVIDPKDFPTEAQYVNKIKQRFCQFFDQVYQLYLKEKQKEAQNQQNCQATISKL